MNAKDKVISILKTLSSKFSALGRSKQIAIVFAVIVVFFFLGKSNDTQSNIDTRSNSDSNQSSNERVADINLALNKKIIKLPYKIGRLTIKKFDAYRSYYYAENGTNEPITWKVDIQNDTSTEIATTVNICSSNSTAGGNTRLKQAYLADCEPIPLRMLPNSVAKSQKFATSNAWFYKGDTLRICIKNKGCYVHTFLDGQN